MSPAAPHFAGQEAGRIEPRTFLDIQVFLLKT
jgi:hypothetical protein